MVRLRLVPVVLVERERLLPPNGHWYEKPALPADPPRVKFAATIVSVPVASVSTPNVGSN